MMGWGGHGYGMWGMGWAGGIMMVVFWVVVIIMVILLFRHRGAGLGCGHGTEKRGDPLEILKERYARGEIGTQEYEERKKTLTQS